MDGNVSNVDIPFPLEEIAIRADIRDICAMVDTQMNHLDIETIKCNFEDIVNRLNRYLGGDDNADTINDPTIIAPPIV